MKKVNKLSLAIAARKELEARKKRLEAIVAGYGGKKDCIVSARKELREINKGKKMDKPVVYRGGACSPR